MDLTDVNIAVSYECASDFKFNSNTSVEIQLPKTKNNLWAFENNHVLVNDSTLPYDFIEASCQVDGIDMKIEFCILESISSVIKCRLFGGNFTLFSDVKDKSIQELDFSDLDHTRNWSAMLPLLDTTSGLIYPIIDYGTLTDLNNNIDADFIYPAIHLHTVVNKILSEIGYTLSGDLGTDPEYLKCIIPFSAQQKSFTDDYTDSLFFEAYKSTDQLHDTDVITIYTPPFDVEVSDPSNRWITNTYYALIAASYTFHLKYKIYTVGVSDMVLKIDMCKFVAGGSLEIVQSWEYPTDFTSDGFGIYHIDEDCDPVNLIVNERITFQVHSKESHTVKGGTDTAFSLAAITDYLNGYNELWQVSPNLPNIKQGDLIKYCLQAFGCIVQCDDSTKTIIATKISTIINNAYTGNYDDWSDLLDRTNPETITFKQDVAQINHLKYLDDDNVIKPDGTDYEFRINNRSLPLEKDLYIAPFGASLFTNVFTFLQEVWRVEISGTSEPKPRIMVRNSVTLSDDVYYIHEGAAVSAATTAVNIPYFITSGGFNLGFEDSLRLGKMKDVLELNTSPKQLSLNIRLTPKHINQLDFSNPVWIDLYKSWFYKRKINQFKYGKRDSTVCELVKII